MPNLVTRSCTSQTPVTLQSFHAGPSAIWWKYKAFTPKIVGGDHHCISMNHTHTRKTLHVVNPRTKEDWDHVLRQKETATKGVPSLDKEGLMGLHSPKKEGNTNIVFLTISDTEKSFKQLILGLGHCRRPLPFFEGCWTTGSFGKSSGTTSANNSVHNSSSGSKCQDACSGLCINFHSSHTTPLDCSAVLLQKLTSRFEARNQRLSLINTSNRITMS